MTGFVYAIRCADSPFVKFGASDDPARRARMLQTGCPYPLRLVHTVPGRHSEFAIQLGIASRFGATCVHGDWFHVGDGCTDEDIVDMLDTAATGDDPRIEPIGVDISNVAADLARQTRAARGDMPQTVAADQIGVSLRTLQAWEAGSSFPQWRHRERLTRWLAKRERAAA